MQEIALSIPSERLIGFTVPRGGRFSVGDHDEVWEVLVESSVRVRSTDDNPLELAERSDFVGWGRTDAAPLVRVGGTAISYDFDPRADAVRVRYEAEGTDGEIVFPILSGDWFVASLSFEGDLLVLAEPYRIDLYRVSAS